MGARRGLGKGLDSMIPDKIDFSTSTREKSQDIVPRETELDINMIEPNREQPRKVFNEDALHELAESIRQYGIIQPLIVQRKDNLYEIIAGERRWRAARLAGMKKVPAIVKEYSTQEVMEIALIENIQREDLNPIEEALAYQKLIAEYNLKQDELAEKVAKSRTTITNAMRLLKLDPRVQQMLIDDMISSGHARTLIPVEDGEEQFNLANMIFDKKLSVRETERMVRELLNPKKEKEKTKIISEQERVILKGLEEKMKKIIGSKVSISAKNKNKGKIEIEYYSGDELERILELFQSIQE